jgi:hypothetical protein
MLFRSGKNWAFELFFRRGWLVKRRRIRRLKVAGCRVSTIAAECQSLEQRILLSTITVTSLSDNTTVDGKVTLREALQAANTDASVDGSVAGQKGVQNLIVFSAGLNGTISLAATLGQMSISSSLSITGLGAANTIIDAQQNSRIFNITNTAGNVTLDSLTIENGKTAAQYDSGGAVRSLSTGTLTVTNSTLSGNSTAGNSSYGGAIASGGGGLAVINSTLSGNSTAGIDSYGGAIYSGAGKLTVTNSTLSGNSTAAAFANGGAIYSTGALTVTNSTIAQNIVTAARGGGVFHANGGGAVTLRNTILAQNTDKSTAPDFSPGAGTPVTITHSLIGDNTGSGLTAAPVGSPDANGNLIGSPKTPIDPRLGALADNGGSRQTIALLAGSPAVNAGSNAQATDPGPDGAAGTADDVPLTTDQRGVPFVRIFGKTVDMGAFESQTLNLVVNSTNDTLDSAYDPAQATLRDALALANANPGFDAITFAGVTNGTPIDLAQGVLTINDSVTITGNGAANTIIDARQNSEIFLIKFNNYIVTLDGLTLENGTSTDGGGAISSEGAALTVANCNLSGNSTVGDYSHGGAIWFYGGTLNVTNSILSGNSTRGLNAVGGAIFFDGLRDSTLTVTDCILSGNSTSGDFAFGGAISSSFAPVTITNSTLTENSTAGKNSDGGAISCHTASVTVTNTTIARNHATHSVGGGIAGSGNAAITLRNSILAQNADSGAAPDLSPATTKTVTILHSLIGDNTGAGLTAAPVGSPDANGNLIGTHAVPIDPNLGALAFNGGLMPTMALLAGSPAIDAGGNALATDPGPDHIAGNADDIPLTADQRSDPFSRVVGVVDMGAYEIQPLATPTVNFLVTRNHLPVLTGTDDVLNMQALLVSVNGTTFTLGSSSQLTSDRPGDWTLTTTAPIPDGTYDVVVRSTDASGDVAVDTTTIDLIVDTAAPATTALTGEYAVATQGSSTLTLASISQNGTALTMDGSANASATVTSTTQLQIGGVTATYGDSQIRFGSTGTFANQVWTKLDLPTDYTNPAGARVHITQNGNALIFSDRNGTQSPGAWINPTQIAASNETVTVGSGQSTGQLLWSDGTIWSEVVKIAGTNHGSGMTTIQAVPSKLLVTDYLTGSGATVHTVQTGTTNIVFVDRVGNLVLGTYSPYDPSKNTPQATAPNYPGYTASIVGNTITWTDGNPADTVVWTKTTSPAATITVTDYTNQNGVPVHLVQNGTNAFVIVDGLGNTSLGHFLSATTGVADRYPNDVATFSSSQVIWSDGIFVWTQTSNPPLLITFTDTSSAISHIRLLTATTLVGLDGSFNAVQGTRLNGKIFWSNGQVWDNLDESALNAFFEMGTGYP